MENNESTNIPATGNGNGGKKKTIFILLAVIIVAGVVFGARWIAFRMNYTSTDDAQVDADIIPLSFKVPGRISGIFVGESQEVNKGQKIAELDSTEYRIALDQAQARLDMARGDLEKARAALELTRSSADIGVRQSKTSLGQVRDSVDISATQREINLTSLEAQVERAKINLENAGLAIDEIVPLEAQARKDLERAESLKDSGVISEEQYEKTKTNAETLASRLSRARRGEADAQKQLEIAESNLQAAQIDNLRVGIAERDRKKAGLALELSEDQKERNVVMAETAVRSLEARVRELEAGVERAQVALGDTVITSPVNGIAAKQISLPAEIVPAGKPVFFVVDSDSLLVRANIEEKYLGRFDTGSPATVTIDAIPGEKFEGEVDTVGAAANSKFSLIPASNPSGQFIKVTQRIPVKIMLSGDLSRLKPGMNAIVSIKND